MQRFDDFSDNNKGPGSASDPSGPSDTKNDTSDDSDKDSPSNSHGKEDHDADESGSEPDFSGH